MTAHGTAGGASSGGGELDEAHTGGAATIDRPSTAPARPWTHWALFALLAGSIIAVDQLTKLWLVGVVDPGERISIVGDLLRIVHSRNSGGLFGLFRGSAEIFAVASLGVIALIVVYHARSRPSRLLSIALGLLLGGALGNFIDRVRLGYVIDFVDAGIGTLRFYTFNAADSAITTAILLLIAMALFPRLAGEPVADRPAPAAPGDGADG
jgi:signal peptidase II